MILDYDKEEVFTKQLDIVDMGNVALVGITEDGEEHFFLTKTVMGKTGILKYGPVFGDMPIYNDFFTLTFKKITYKEETLSKEIKMYFNDPKKKIVDIQEITEYEVIKALPNAETTFSEL